MARRDRKFIPLFLHMHVCYTGLNSKTRELCAARPLTLRKTCSRLGLVGRCCERRALAWVWLEDVVEDVFSLVFGLEDVVQCQKKLNYKTSSFVRTSSKPNTSENTSFTTSSSQTQARARLSQHLPTNPKREHVLRNVSGLAAHDLCRTTCL